MPEEQGGLPFKSGQGSIVPNYVIGPGYFLPDRPLAGKHRLGHAGLKPPGSQSDPLGFGRGCDHHNVFEVGCGSGFEEEGEVGEEVLTEVEALRTPSQPALPDHGVDDRFQAASGRRVGEDALTQEGAIDRGGRSGLGQSEGSTHRADDFSIRAEQLVHAGIRVEGRERMRPGEDLPEGRLASSHPASESEEHKGEMERRADRVRERLLFLAKTLGRAAGPAQILG